MSELLELLKKQGQAFEEFKKRNDERLTELERKGHTDPLLEESLEKLNDSFEEIETKFAELEKKAARPPMGSDDELEDAQHKKSYMNFIRKGVDEELAELQQKALQMSVDADGGFAMPKELDKNILALLKEQSPMRQVCNQMTIGGVDYSRLVDLGGTTSGWVGETDERPNTDTPQLASITPVMGELYANPMATQKSLDDIYFNAESWLATSVAEEFAKQEGAAFLSGDGNKKPKGLLAYPSAAQDDKTRPFGTLEHLGAASPTAITADELIDLEMALKQGHRQNARWMLNRRALRFLRKIKDADGNYLWQPGLQQGQPSTLLGYGISENDDMADLAANAISVMFGDFKRCYTIVDRFGIRTLRDPYTKKPYVQFYTTKRVGGMLVDSEAVKLLKMGA